ncbi:PAS domain-containing sensor histidine kinase [Natrinema versiforme]|uniref:histidine kinase n=1 Tax=Natrinema versiforme JCM 10478 TaxID=1227496 RepID=L9XN82_9EURY|nr:PAS domain-containing sensor histidine kinase [Natrinema versiforme]ELY63259.1 signal-transducing histidine kinase [Natrinema versiforme JCM 10478]
MGTKWSVSDDRFRYLIEHVQDAIVEFELVDGDPIIRDSNAAFVDVFGYESAEIVGEPLNELIVPPWETTGADSFDEQISDGAVSYHRVHRETADGLREFLYRAIPYETDDERTRAFAIYTDLTEVNRYERQFKVFARLLRHNLRTELTVINGHLEALTGRLEELDPATAEHLRAIAEAEEALADLVDEARTIHTELETPPPSDPAIDCVPLLEAVAESYSASYPTADIRTDLPTELAVVATDRLEAAVAALVENAIEHNPNRSPLVRVTAQASGDGWATVIVADDGPEIPAIEQRVVTDETDISQIDHSSGLGLWIVRWTIERFGGTVAFETVDGGGNRVRLRLRLSPSDD